MTPERIRNVISLSFSGLLISTVVIDVIVKSRRASPLHFATAQVAGGRQVLVASFWTPDVVTSLDIKYTDVISENDDAKVELTIRQRTVYRPTPGYEEMDASNDSRPRPEEIQKLAWSIAPSLESSAFDFGGERVDARPQGAVLPLRLIWTATPNKTGNRQLKLDARTIYRPVKQQGDDSRYVDSIGVSGYLPISLTLNGREQSLSADDDIPLPIEVLKSPGIPVGWYDGIALASAILTFFFGSTFAMRWLKHLSRFVAAETQSTTQAPSSTARTEPTRKKTDKPRSRSK